MSQDDASLRMTDTTFEATLEKITAVIRLITEAQVNASPKIPAETDVHAITEAIFRTHFRLPYPPFFRHVSVGYVQPDLINLARDGFTNQAIRALAGPLFSAYATGMLLGWMLREAVEEPVQ